MRLEGRKKQKLQIFLIFKKILKETIIYSSENILYIDQF